MTEDKGDHSYKIIYFDVRGRAEPARAMLLMSGTAFEDERIAFKDWPALKPTTPLGVLPILETEEGRLVPTIPIYNLLAGRLGYEPESDWDKAQSECLLIFANDLCSEVGSTVYSSLIYKFIPVPDDIDKRIEKTRQEIYKGFKFLLGLAKPGMKFLFGDKITIADVVLYTSMEFCSVKFPETRMSVDGLNDWAQNMEEDEKFKNYLQIRKPGATGT